MLLPAGPSLWEALCAALAGDGPAILPISSDAPGERVAALLDALRPHDVLTADGTNGRSDGVPVADDVAVVIATSGSTGEPKGVELSRDALLHSAGATLARVAARPGDRWLCCLPASHIAGIQVLTRSWLAGTEPVIHARFNVAATLDAGAAHIAVVPTQLHRLLRAGADLSVFSAIVLGGAAAHPDLLAAARAAGGRVFTTYGMSETCGGCVYDGVPLHGVEVDLRDVENGVGRIALAGPMLFNGYRLRPESTEAVRDGRWFVTADLGRFTGAGALQVLGRVDDIINTGGEKVVAGEVARELSHHPAVGDVVVVGRADPEWGERVTAVVVPAEPDAPPTLEELRQHARVRLPGYAAPRELELVAEIPLLASGKPDRNALRERTGDRR